MNEHELAKSFLEALIYSARRAYGLTKEELNELCQDEPHLIATSPEEADELIEMWEKGK